MCRLVRDRAGTDRVCTHNDNNPRWLTLSHTQGTIRSVEGLRGEREQGRAEPSASPQGGSEDFTSVTMLMTSCDILKRCDTIAVVSHG